ncbi:YbaK/EbsC family protein [Streptomyces bicolor]|uniref:YbaK/EbsC family protein n=1 Tax=Streptomyces bicolor TaxID=66874 RepID=UPI0004E1A09B|nr:YbaK/EbsC family protein [Streptomyces bicolor]
MSRTVTEDAYSRLITLLDGSEARYRLIHHAPEGRTDLASRLRGHRLEQAAKCLVIRVGLGKKHRRYVLTVVPGDRRADLERVRGLYDGTDAAFAARDVAERLAGSVSGSIMPFSFDPGLDLLVDPDLLDHEEIFFNAARLDRSVALRTGDYVKLADPRIEPVADAPVPTVA